MNLSCLKLSLVQLFFIPVGIECISMSFIITNYFDGSAWLHISMGKTIMCIL